MTLEQDRPLKRVSQAESACAPSPTSCRAHTRLYQQGQLVSEGFPVEDISEHLADPTSVIWLDLEDPDKRDLGVITEELGLHPLAVDDAVNDRQRPKLDTYEDHLFLNCYLTSYDATTRELTTREVGAFVTNQALVTIRKDPQIELEPVLTMWDTARTGAADSGVGFLLHGLIDHVVDTHFAVVQDLDDAVEDLEEVLFGDQGAGDSLQRQTFALRKSLVQLRRVVLPMREVVNSLLRRDLGLIDEGMAPYYQDVYDHVLRAAEWTESLRDMVGSVLETNATLQGNRLNVTVRKLTAYAAILAVTTAITGFYGQNVPYPGFSARAGFVTSSLLLAASVVGLLVFFKKRRYL